MRRVCVFCGSKCGLGSTYVDAARHFAESLRSRGIGLVYGGGDIGLMGILADTMLPLGGEVIGVIPRFLEAKELARIFAQGVKTARANTARTKPRAH